MLIKNIDEAQYVMRLSKAVTYEKLEQHLKNAEITYIMHLLGSAMYNKLLAYHDDLEKYKITDPSFSFAYQAPGQGEPELSEADYYMAVVLWYAQHAVLNLAYHIGFDMLNAYVSDQGFRRIESDKTKSMFKYQEDNLKRYFIKSGMDSMDVMLSVMEEKKEHFSDFADKLKEIKSNIIPTTTIFHQHYNINQSRLIFLRLKQHIKAVEELYLENILGKENYNTIKAELLKTEPDAKVTALLPYMRDVIAYLSTMMLMQETGAEISERGLYFTGMRSIMDSGLEMPTDEKRVTDLIARNKEIAERYITRLRRFMLTSGQWTITLGSGRGTINRDNAGKRTFVA